MIHRLWQLADDMLEDPHGVRVAEVVGVELGVRVQQEVEAVSELTGVLGLGRLEP